MLAIQELRSNIGDLKRPLDVLGKIIGMRERVAAVNGEINFAAAPEKGNQDNSLDARDYLSTNYFFYHPLDGRRRCAVPLERDIP